MENKQRAPYGKLFGSMFLISACTFGGGFVIVSLMKKKFVDEYKWLTQEQMLDMTAIAQSSPGAIAVNAALQVGFLIGGAAAAAVAVAATILPPLLLISVLSFLYAAVRDSAVIATLLQGMQLGVGAVLLDVTCSLGKPVLKSRSVLLIGVMAAAFILSSVLHVNVVYIILGTALVGVFRAWLVAYSSKGGQGE